MLNSFPIMSLISRYPVWKFQAGSRWSLLTSVYKEEMDQWLLVVTTDPAAKEFAIDLEVAGAGPVHCHFFPSPLIPNYV